MTSNLAILHIPFYPFSEACSKRKEFAPKYVPNRSKFLSFRIHPFSEVYSKRKEFAPIGSKFFSFRIHPFVKREVRQF